MWVWKNDQTLRKCLACGALFMRRVWQQPGRVQIECISNFEKRDSCSRHCAFHLVKEKRDAALPIRLCAFCEKPMRARTHRGDIKRTDTCSSFCGTKLWALHNLDKYPPKKCERCKADLIRRRRETPAMWAKRRFCGYSCSASFRGKKR
jgi:hypothetical protein